MAKKVEGMEFVQWECEDEDSLVGVLHCLASMTLAEHLNAAGVDDALHAAARIVEWDNEGDISQVVVCIGNSFGFDYDVIPYDDVAVWLDNELEKGRSQDTVAYVVEKMPPSHPWFYQVRKYETDEALALRDWDMDI